YDHALVTPGLVATRYTNVKLANPVNAPATHCGVERVKPGPSSPSTAGFEPRAYTNADNGTNATSTIANGSHAGSTDQSRVAQMVCRKTKLARTAMTIAPSHATPRARLASASA